MPDPFSAPPFRPDSIRVLLHGVRGSIPAPGPHTTGYGGNTPSVELMVGEDRIFLDAGTGIREPGRLLALEPEPPSPWIFLTHYHWDHIQGLPFFAPLYRPGARVRIAGPEPSPGELLPRLLDERHFPVPFRQVAAEVETLTLEPGPFTPDDGAGWSIEAHRVRHPSLTFGYRLRTAGSSLAYLPDHELRGGSYEGDGPERRAALVRFLVGSDLLIHDAMYDDEEIGERAGWGHSSARQAIELAHEAGVSRLVLFHHAPEAADSELEHRLDRARQEAGGGLEVMLAREGDSFVLSSAQDRADLGPAEGGHREHGDGSTSHERPRDRSDGGGPDPAEGSPGPTRHRSEIRALTEVGTALMSERDPDRLLHLILEYSLDLTGADAGTLYLANEDSGLLFRLALNRSLPDLEPPKAPLPVDRSSIAGYVADSGELLAIDDVYAIPDGAPYRFNPSFDRAHGYRARSMITLPMTNPRGETVGVLQLINRRVTPHAPLRDAADVRLHTRPFSRRDIELARSLAGQAAVSIQNTLLQRDIEALLEGFALAMVTAIDQRDPATSGHSVRVSSLTCDLARHVDAAREGPFRHVHFTAEEMRELRYAGLLHDIGKVGVREELLLKERKLPPAVRERIRGRFALNELRVERSATGRSGVGEDDIREGPSRHDPDVSHPIGDRRERIREIRAAWELVARADEPAPLSDDDLRRLEALNIGDPDDAPVDGAWILDEEWRLLSIPRGNLSMGERREIEAHTMHSWRILSEIPWTADLDRIPEIGLTHHEKLDGSGYPNGTTGSEIPIQVRLLTVADIFDALTAMDRPYKEAMPPERALAILRDEAAQGKLDADVVELLVETRAWERILNTDWRSL